MCTVSMVGDHYSDKWRHLTQPNTAPFNPYGIGFAQTTPFIAVSKHEFDVLKKEVEDMKALLLKAKAYDEKNGEPHCEMEDKVALLKKVAEMVGVDLKDVFPQA